MFNLKEKCDTNDGLLNTPSINNSNYNSTNTVIAIDMRKHTQLEAESQQYQ